MRRLPAYSILLLALTGCTEQAPPPAARPVPVETVEEVPPDDLMEPVLVSQLKLEIINWEGTQAIVGENPGKIVVMDLWSTSCPPCLKELPGLVALQAKYPEVVCVSVALDYDGDPKAPPESLEPDIRKILEKIKADKVRNVLLSTSTDDLFQQIEHKSMPILYVFDQTGKRVGAFPDRKNPTEPSYKHDIVPLVENLLAAPKP